MNLETQRALRAINQRFYDRFASEFDTSRGRPWPGWERIAARLSPTLSVLDAGCGNGRFGAFLAQRTDNLRYLGVDGCDELLQAAQGRLQGFMEAPELRRLDVLGADLDHALGNERFDLIVLFGVLHHVPGIGNRQGLIRRLGRRLAPTGALAVSIWRFDQTPRFRRRVVPWPTHNQQRAGRDLKPVDLETLEAGDTLLSWGGDIEHPRYCHFPDDAEIDSLITAPRLRLSDRFEADGPSGSDNLYLVWQAAPQVHRSDTSRPAGNAC